MLPIEERVFEKEELTPSVSPFLGDSVRDDFSMMICNRPSVMFVFVFLDDKWPMTHARRHPLLSDGGMGTKKLERL
jgi:hypothetical protein